MFQCFFLSLRGKYSSFKAPLRLLQKQRTKHIIKNSTSTVIVNSKLDTTLSQNTLAKQFPKTSDFKVFSFREATVSLRSRGDFLLHALLLTWLLLSSDGV
eukprot:TRINITY_DN668_c0_g1_i5.p1 TRINITY_DN668_c0_g1~~TRINITY_DN668_c0_g1_i5.p1  ORF type:complete len:100 (-),score=7.60 TRINITY_DN668_c0_g1_i5:57-356(-)